MNRMLGIAMFVLISVLVKETCEVTKIDPRQNMWVTWANQTGQDSFCLSLTTPSNPFRTCLIEVPVTSMAEFEFWSEAKIDPKSALRAQAVAVTQDLTIASAEPYELDLKGSVPGNYCLVFGHFVTNSSLLIVKKKQSKVSDTWLSPKSPLYYNNSEYCNNWTKSVMPPKDFARRLPPGIFLICGDRAWSAIPQEAVGGPCYFGKLAMFAPSIHQVLGWSKETRRAKHSVLQLDQNCKDNIILWNRAAVISASILTAGVASAQALTQLKFISSFYS